MSKTQCDLVWELGRALAMASESPPCWARSTASSTSTRTSASRRRPATPSANSSVAPAAPSSSRPMESAALGPSSSGPGVIAALPAPTGRGRAGRPRPAWTLGPPRQSYRPQGCRGSFRRGLVPPCRQPRSPKLPGLEDPWRWRWLPRGRWESLRPQRGPRRPGPGAAPPSEPCNRSVALQAAMGPGPPEPGAGPGAVHDRRARPPARLHERHVREEVRGCNTSVC